MPELDRMRDTGWMEPQRIDQLELLGEGRDRVLALAGVSIDEIERWRSSGWISFDVRETASLDSGETAEITFVRNLARSGLSDLQIGRFLSELSAPYTYDPLRTAYSFALGWVRRPLAPSEIDLEEFIEDNIGKWIEQKVLLGEVDVLRRVCSQIFDALTEAGAIRGEDDDG